MAEKSQELPENFSALIKENNIEALKKVFDSCELDARDSYKFSKATALSCFGISDEFVRWLVAQGADIEAVNYCGRTALHEHASCRSGDIAIFLELGANVDAIDRYGATPLHCAADHNINVDAVKQLIEYGANVNALNDNQQTPLEYVLKSIGSGYVVELLEVVQALLAVNNTITVAMKDEVTRIGKDYEFYRKESDSEFRKERDEALSTLYQIFDVTPVKRRVIHDGVSPIVVNATTWKKQYNELWDLLIPASGSAKTVQGELIRIAGRVKDEIHRNGGGNWDSNYKKMLDALLIHLSSANSLPDNKLEEVSLIIKEMRKSGNGDDKELNLLCKLATKWVLLNPMPIVLDKPKYKR